MRTDYRPQTIAQRPCHCFVVSLLAMTLVITTVFITTAHADIKEGLIGYWAFEEGSGNATKDFSGNKNIGTFVNQPTWTSDSQIGSRALQFDGVDDKVDVGDLPALENQTKATWSMWVKPLSIASLTSFLSKHRTNNHTASSWLIGTTSSTSSVGMDEIGMRFAAWSGCSTNANVLKVGQWVHAVFVFDGTQTGDANRLKIYIDGVYTPSVCGAVGIIPSVLSDVASNVNMGGTVNNAAYSHVVMDDVRIYNRAISAEEARELFFFRPIPDVTAPSVPENLVSFNIKSHQVSISWNASTDVGGGHVDGYKIYRSGILLGTSATNTYIDTTVTPSSTYSYTVSAYDDVIPVANHSAQSQPLSVTTANTDLTAPVISKVNVTAFATVATITWSTDEESDAQIEYGTNTDYGAWSMLDANLTTEHSQLIPALLPSTTYYYRLRSKDTSPTQNVGLYSGQFTTPVFTGPIANDITEPGEACDGKDLNGLTCTSVAAGFTGGILKCKVDRKGYDVSQCVAAGRIIQAASCENKEGQIDVQNAVDQAQDGDTVKVPSGTCVWTLPVTIGQYDKTTRVTTGKSIIFQGEGIDKTIIIENIKTSGSALMVKIERNKPVRVTGFTFDGAKTLDNNASVSVSGPPGTPLFRIDHCKFRNVTERGIYAVSGVYGLIDNNVFLRMPTGIFNPTLISVVGDADSWKRPQDAGTANQVYMEDNILVHHIQANGPFDMYDGARYVFRNNKVFGNGLGHHGFDSGTSGIVNFEIYDNHLMNGLPADSPYLGIYAIVAKVDFANADKVNGEATLASLLNSKILEEISGGMYVRLKTIGIPRPLELSKREYTRIWRMLNGAFVHGGVLSFRAGSGVVFNNIVAKPMDLTTRDTGYYDGFAGLKSYRSSDGYPLNYGSPFPWNGLNPGNGICDGSHPVDGNEPLPNIGAGMHTGNTGVFVLQDDSKNWTPGALVEHWVYNLTKGLKAKIIANTANQLTLDAAYPSNLHAGPQNRKDFNITWTKNDQYKITNGYPCHDQMGRSAHQSFAPVYSWNNDFQGKIGGHMRAVGYANSYCPKGMEDLSIVDNPFPGVPIGWVCKEIEIIDELTKAWKFKDNGLEQKLYERINLHVIEGRDYFNGIPKPGYIPYVYPHPLAQIDESVVEAKGGSGDVSNDGKITMFDAALVLRYTLGSTLSDVQKQKADINADAKIDGSDVIAIGRKALGL